MWKTHIRDSEISRMKGHEDDGNVLWNGRSSSRYEDLAIQSGAFCQYP